MKETLPDSLFHIELGSDDESERPVSSTHFHESYEIYYLVENEVQYYIDGKSYYVKPGMVAVIHPHTIHATHPLNDKTRKWILVNVPVSFFENILEDDPCLLSSLPEAPFPSEGADRKKIENLLYKLHAAYTSEQKNNVLIKAYLIELTVLLNRIAKDKNDPELYDADHITTKQMLDITEYIGEHFSEPLTLKRLSDTFHLNPSYISRSMKSKLNISFSKHLRTVRIKEVCYLLANTNLSLSEIASKTGFESTSNLCRVFKSVTGETAIQYKTLHKD